MISARHRAHVQNAALQHLHAFASTSFMPACMAALHRAAPQDRGCNLELHTCWSARAHTSALQCCISRACLLLPETHLLRGWSCWCGTSCELQLKARYELHRLEYDSGSGACACPGVLRRPCASTETLLNATSSLHREQADQFDLGRRSALEHPLREQAARVNRTSP